MNSISIRKTEIFDDWIKHLADINAKARINMRVQRIAQGNFGDVASVGYGIWEMRIHYGPGYRVYYCRIGSDIVLLLCGGDKSSQYNDILRAKRIMAEVKSAKDAGDKEYWR